MAVASNLGGPRAQSNIAKTGSDFPSIKEANILKEFKKTSTFTVK